MNWVIAEWIIQCSNWFHSNVASIQMKRWCLGNMFSSYRALKNHMIWSDEKYRVRVTGWFAYNNMNRVIAEWIIQCLGRISFVTDLMENPFLSPSELFIWVAGRNSLFNWLYLFGFKKLYQSQKSTTKLIETQSQVNCRSWKRIVKLPTNVSV
jgi:hypothetical protein